MPPATTRTRPIEVFAKAVGGCSAEASAYGKCIFRDYKNVSRDMCLADFLRFKECVTLRLKTR